LRLAEPLAPTLSVDLDGDGRDEVVSASGRRGDVSLEVRDAGGARLAEAKAPAPPGDVVRLDLTSGSLGSAGALVEVDASTDAARCVSIWRLRGGRLERVPMHDEHGKELPDCGPPAGWTYRFERESGDRPSVLVRERTENSPQGALHVREVFAFAGFSLDVDPKRSTRAISGVEIPRWFGAVLYSDEALYVLNGRYDLSRMRSQPTIRIQAERDRGVFAVELSSPSGSAVAPVESSAEGNGGTVLGVRLGQKTGRVTVRLGGADKILPMQVEVAGLGEPWDQLYGPAGSWHGRAERVFADASDELAADHLPGIWVGPAGSQMPIELEGSPPYRVRVGPDVFRLDLAGAEKPVDILLVPESKASRGWGIVLRGKNAIERVPMACSPAVPGGLALCRSDGSPERMRRLGARLNAS
jgi:hypothetical protein